jgi:hypothetical protein
MMDWAAAAHRDVPCSSGTGTVGCGLAGPLDGPVPGNVGIAVSERLVCPGRRAPSRPPLKAPGLTVSGFSLSTVPMSNYDRIYVR